MAINYDHLMGLKREGDRFKYTDRETMLYAIGIGMGADPLDRNELPFVFEQPALKTVPSMATVLARVPLLKDCGYDYTKVVHGEQHLTLHRPLPPEGELIASARVTAAYDKGAGKGAVIYTETVVRSAADGQPMFTLVSSTFARGDGGFGGPSGSGPQPHAIPERKPDATATLPTRKDQALLYRLNGDRNPLHADPELAKRVGFPGADPARPLHLRHRLPRHPADGRGLRSHAHHRIRRALFGARLSRRSDRHRHLGRRRDRLLPLPRSRSATTSS